MIETFTDNPQPPQFIIFTEYYAGSMGQEPMHLFGRSENKEWEAPLGTDQPAGRWTEVRRKNLLRY